jgi:integrase
LACIRKRRGRWVIDFYDQQGLRRWKTMKKGATKEEAKEELRITEEQIETGTYLPAGKVPTFSALAREWVDHKRLKLRETTWEVYEGHVRNHFGDLINLKIKRINIATVEKFFTDRQAAGMNLGTLRKILVTLGQIFNYAVRHKYINHNPLREAERPRRQPLVDEDDFTEQEDMQILTPPQINAFLNQEYPPKYQMLFTIAIFTGARQGELLGLKWGDVDWKSQQIGIRRTFNKGRFFLPKTKTSRRKIDLAPTVVTALKKWKLACPKNELNLIFPNESGKPINYSNMMQRHFFPALEKASLPRIRFHDLRHTYASLLIDQGENIKYIQVQLGHSSPTVTLNVYAHLMKPANQEAVCRLENAIFGGNGSKMVAGNEKGARSKTVTP